MKRSPLRRVGGSFDDFVSNFIKRMQQESKQKINYTQFTNDLSSWIKEENLDRVIERRFKNRGGKLF